MKTKILTQALAKELDKYLMSSNGCNFSIDTLMELAGLSCSQVVEKVYPTCTYKSVLVCCGPGNNGGDGLVVARHLSLFGYSVEVFYPIRKPNPTYKSLVDQLVAFEVPLYDELPDLKRYKLVVDALLGFSFLPPVRDPFIQVLLELKGVQVPIVSIDVPSGWPVDSEPKDSFMPETLISLTLPKPCSELFTGKYHYVAGRFVPPKVASQFGIELYPFEKSKQYLQLQ